MANRLIALSKCPDVHPIGIGECLKHVIDKMIGMVTGNDLQTVGGAEQLA